MHVVRPEVDVERPAGGRGAADEVGGRVLVDGRDLRPVDVHDRPPPEPVAAERVRRGRRAVERVAEAEDARAEPLEVRQRLLEAVLGDQRGLADVALAAHVPLAEVAGRVAGLVQEAGQHRGGGIEPLRNAAVVVRPAVVQERRDAVPLRVLPRADRDAGGRADRRVDVEPLEADALRGEAVDVLRLDPFVAEAGEIAPAHVVDKHEQHVRRGRERRGEQCGGEHGSLRRLAATVRER